MSEDDEQLPAARGRDVETIRRIMLRSTRSASQPWKLSTVLKRISQAGDLYAFSPSSQEPLSRDISSKAFPRAFT